jgi:adenine specific DNA methylase Mod
MKKNPLTTEELKTRIARLSSFRGTFHEHRSDKRYIKLYKNALEEQQRPQKHG